MAYIHITHSPGVGMTQYRAVRAALGPAPIPGNTLHIAGESDGVLHIVDVWRSAAEAERWAAEHLFPAFTRAGVPMAADTRFEIFEGEVPEGLW